MYALLDYDLKSLRVFKAIADSGGLSAAELALDMSLPMISTYLSVLEQRLGVKLCNRGRRGFELTAEGQSLYRSLDSLLRSEEHTSELQSLMRISYAVFCLKKKKQYTYQPKKLNLSAQYHKNMNT